MSFERIWEAQDAHVESGRIAGYVAAVRIGERTEIRAGGRMAIEPDSPPMREDTLFRIASVTKPIGGALALSLVEDGVIALDDPIERWLPEAARPRVLVAPDAPLDRTTEADRAITVRHLLTMTAGWGAVMEPTPLQEAMRERGVFPSSRIPQMSGDEFVARVAEPAARVPARREVAVRHAARRPRRAHRAGDRQAAVGARRRAHHRPARHDVHRLRHARGRPPRHRLHAA